MAPDEAGPAPEGSGSGPQAPRLRGPAAPPPGAVDPQAAGTGTTEAVTAGLVTALVGFTSAFAVVLAGLRAVGASPAQAASGLLAVTVAMGLATMLLSWRTRLPITVAWSTPGAALLATTGAVEGGWPAAVGAFAVCGMLLAAVGLSRRLAFWAQLIPAPIANAMLAGVLLGLCLAPVRALVAAPAVVGPVVLVWIVLLRVARRWAVPASMALAVGLAFTEPGVRALGARELAPQLSLTAPSLTAAAVVSLAVPLFVVTMASQNIPGIAVLAGFGYRAPVRSTMLVTGAGTVLAAPFGGHAINLAAISAALAAGPEAGADPARRWRAAMTAGCGYVVLGAGSSAVAAVALAAPEGLVEAAAGLALVATLAAALGGAFSAAAPSAPGLREAAAVTFLVTVSGVQPGGVSSAFWGLAAGLAVLGVLRASGPRRGAPD
ncbi:benzoate/H(+) symporter BenE family transporter [Cellulomonas chengniuliangii]|uniref:Benzoate/H(+) symporter BenE family transporter n=1 Tax=Cellulomonas chengniuliangii TaxID=2968084 RepID=A0ABY5KUR4_9CELL|nr:benzoate/H(+) symporter BenE family transporter [Cellulomonas chengniuliangii]MCC2308983.1 benzoate/H(+) symporter BenE family transporter [Cellulomonas chengniuliangii]UUI74282.1 benzoate/H(+) symporter BenE family transporter [Cellulomonas chengniuliangii]